MSTSIVSFFEKVNGIYFGLFGLLLSSVTMFGSILIYLQSDPTFFVTTNFISDLSVGPNSSDVLFALSIIIMGLFFIPYFLFIGIMLINLGAENKNLIWAGFLFFMIYGISSILLAFFPLDTSNKSTYDMHINFAFGLFSGAAIGMLLYGHIENQVDQVPKYFAYNSGLVGIFTGLFAVLLILGNYTQFYTYNIIIYIVEWTAFALFILWFILHIFFNYRLNSKN